MTNWLHTLGLIDAPADTVLEGAELGLRGLFPGWAAALLFAGGAIAAFLFYRWENVKLGPARRLILACLRTALIALAVLLLMRPVLLATYKGERRRPVVVLVDVSQSMSIADRRVSERDLLRSAIALGQAAHDAGPAALEKLGASKLATATRMDLVKSVLSSPQLALLERLAEKGPVQAYVFGRRPSAAPEGWVASLAATEPQTAIADCVHALLSRQEDGLPAAMVLITDGRDTASTHTFDEVGKACAAQGVPLHVWGVGSSEAGALEIKDARVPRTIFVDEKPDLKDDPVEVPVRFRCRGFKKGVIELTLKVGDQTVTETMPVQEGENLVKVLRLDPKKGAEGERPVSVRIRLRDQPDVADEVNRVAQVKNSRVKVLYIESTPRREYKFIQPTLDRDRRVLLRLILTEGDERLALQPPDAESGAMFLDKFPESFPEPHAKDPDRRPYDLVILGDVPLKALTEKGAEALKKWVKEGGGLACIAGRAHMPSEYASPTIAEMFPVEFRRDEPAPDADGRSTQAFRPVLTHEGENSPLMSLEDNQQANLKLWREDLWKDVPGFYWYYPVTDLRPGATALLTHPERKVGRKPEEKLMPLIATHYYGKGEVLYVGVEETWRWRDNTGDRLTARFWGTAAVHLGLPHLLGNARRTQIDLEGGEPVVGQYGAVKVRLLDQKYEPLRRDKVLAQLVSLEGKGEASVREVVLKSVPRQPGEYRATLPNDVPGRHEIRIPAGDGVEASSLPFRVELPPRHELLQVGLADEALASLASASGGRLYREEQLHTLAASVPTAAHPFTERREVVLWGPLALALFVLLITAEWVVRKFSNLS
jgi:hypothetical protein